MSGAGPTGGDKRVEAATRFRPGQRVRVGTHDGEYVSYAGGQFHTHRYRIVWPGGTRSTIVDTALDRDMQAIPDDRDLRVEAALRAALDDLGWDWEPEFGVPSPEAALHSTIVAALTAADAVAAQDPAPRAEPAAPFRWFTNGRAYSSEATAARASERAGGTTVVPLYRRPAPAPVVPDEADQATTDLDRAWAKTGPFTTAAAEEMKQDAATRTRARRDAGWRLVPPTGGAS